MSRRSMTGTRSSTAPAGRHLGRLHVKLGFIGRGMHLEFCHPTYHTTTTSRTQTQDCRLAWSLENCNRMSLGEAETAPGMRANRPSIV